MNELNKQERRGIHQMDDRNSDDSMREEICLLAQKPIDAFARANFRENGPQRTKREQVIAMRREVVSMGKT